jgi:hypothetical protein
MSKWVILWDDDPNDVAGTFYSRRDALAYIWGMTAKWNNFRVEKLPNNVTHFICSDPRMEEVESYLSLRKK